MQVQPRVLHVITDTNRRGAQVFAVDLSQSLAEFGTPGAVVALAPGGVGAHLDVPVLGRRARDLGTLRSLRQRMRTSDVVVAHGSKTLLACSVAGARLGTPLVYRNISDPAFWLSSRARRARVKLMLDRAVSVIALWPGGARYLVERLGISGTKIHVIPNSVHADGFRPPTEGERNVARRRFGLPEDGRVLLYIAALQAEKHPCTAVEALVRLPADMHLLMLGDGTQREAVTALAEQIAPGRVVVAGQVPDPVSGYWAGDVMVLPSEGEGLPAVLIEAALCGVPAVASTSGGNEDIVLHGRTGHIVDPADATQLAEGVLRVWPLRRQMGETAREHCLTRYGMETVTRQWHEALAPVLATRAVTRP